MAKHKIVILGPDLAGKTQVYTRLVGKHPYSDKYLLLVGPQSGGKEVQYWDFGADRTTQEINKHLQTAHKICLVFDATDKDWQTHLDTYRADLTIPAETPIILVAAKTDQLTEPEQTQMQAAAADYARTHLAGAVSVLVAARTDYGILALSEEVKRNLPPLVDPRSLVTIRKRSSFALKARVNQPDLEDLNIDELVENLDMIASNSNSTPERVDTPLKNIENDPHGVARRLDPDFTRVSDRDDATPNHTPARVTQSQPQPSTSRRSAPRLMTTTTAAHPPEARIASRSYSVTEPANPTPQPRPTYFSMALYIAGMTLMLAALVSLIYLALVAASVVSAAMLMTAVNSVLVTVGGLLGMATPLATFSAACAGWGISAATGANLLATSVSLLTMALGYGLKQWSHSAVASELPPGNNVPPPQPPQTGNSGVSLVLRILGATLMILALVNLIYLALIAAGILNAVALTTAMNYLVVTVGSMLNITAPIVAFTNACAAIGLSTPVAAGLISAAGSALLAGIGFGIFRCGKPATAEVAPANTEVNEFRR